MVVKNTNQIYKNSPREKPAGKERIAFSRLSSGKNDRNASKGKKKVSDTEECQIVNNFFVRKGNFLGKNHRFNEKGQEITSY